MGSVFLLFVFLATSYLVLRKICLAATERRPPAPEIFIIGLVTWVFLLCLSSWIFLPFYILYDLLVNGALPGMLPLIFIGTATGLAFYVHEMLDSATVFHFVRQSAFFRPMKPKSVLLQEELDKKKIRDIHRETSGKPFPKPDKEKRLLTRDEVQQYKKEMLAAKDRPARSNRFEEEMKKLRSGGTANVSDPWKVYTFSHKLHNLYTEISNILIDPTGRTLRFNLNVRDAAAGALQDPIYLYRLKQELYHLLQVLNTDPWLAWYSEFYDRIVFVCYGIEPDSFGHIQIYPFMKIDIQRSQLSRREGLFFNAGDLHTICVLTFNDGNPLAGEAE